MTDRAKQLRLRGKAISNRRSRLRKAGLLPPLPVCPCGKRALSDRWQGFCSVCARALGLDTRNRLRTRPRRSLRLAAGVILLELLHEGREAGR